jgi:ceramide glucosyltransferase
MVDVASGLVLFGLALLAVMAVAQRRQLCPCSGPRLTGGPGVSVLKPLKGADPDLEGNLESFFRLDYPVLEILLGVRDADDPAVAVARRVASRHPEVPSRIVVDPREVGRNPKVNNLANLLVHARHQVILISDSNVRVQASYLADLVAELERPGVGLVSSPIRGVADRSLGARLEAMQLNTFVMGGVSAMHALGGVCVVGKSMLLRRRELDRLGGFEFLSRYLAEDQVCGEEISRQGLRVALAHRPVDNVLGTLGVRQFLARHLRWARIRRRMSLAGYLGELVLNPLFLATILAVVARTRPALLLLLATAVVKSSIDAYAERTAGSDRPRFERLWLGVARDLLVGVVWLVPFFSSTVSWRGNRFAIGRRTVLVPDRPALGEADALPAAELPAGLVTEP